MENTQYKTAERVFPVYGFDDPAVCSRCARKGLTCCHSSAEDGVVAPVSEAEWHRMTLIAPWTTGEGFIVRESNSANFVEQMTRLFPDRPEMVRRAFPADGSHYRLAMNHLGQCVFLGPHGCLLAKAARPLFCHIFPFWLMGGELQVFGNPDCLALQVSETIPDLCAAMAMSREEIVRLYGELCQAWGLGRPNAPGSADG